MTTKLQINLQEGFLSVEGEESFVRAMYNDFKENLFDTIGQEKKNKNPKSSEGTKKTVFL